MCKDIREHSQTCLIKCINRWRQNTAQRKFWSENVKLVVPLLSPIKYPIYHSAVINIDLFNLWVIQLKMVFTAALKLV